MDVGTNAVTVYVSDVAGNTATCTANVTVEDNTAPVISCIGKPLGPLYSSTNCITTTLVPTKMRPSKLLVLPVPTSVPTAWCYTMETVVHNTTNWCFQDPSTTRVAATVPWISHCRHSKRIARWYRIGTKRGSDPVLELRRFLYGHRRYCRRLTSTDIGVSEAGSTYWRIFTTHRYGTFYPDFTWTDPHILSPGDLNAGQTFVAPPSSLW